MFRAFRPWFRPVSEMLTYHAAGSLLLAWSTLTPLNICSCNGSDVGKCHEHIQSWSQFRCDS